MKKSVWLYLLAIPCASFGMWFLCSILFDVGLTGLGGLLTMGMLVLGWPLVSVWLGCAAGEAPGKWWFLPVLFALTMPFVFPYYGAYVLACCYGGVVLIVGLIAMIVTRQT